MGSVIPLKKSANSAYLDLKNLLNKKLTQVENLIQLKLESEIDLIKNWDGFEVIMLSDQERNTVQIDELNDLLQVLNGGH